MPEISGLLCEVEFRQGNISIVQFNRVNEGSMSKGPLDINRQKDRCIQENSKAECEKYVEGNKNTFRDITITNLNVANAVKDQWVWRDNPASDSLTTTNNDTRCYKLNNDDIERANKSIVSVNSTLTMINSNLINKEDSKEACKEYARLKGLEFKDINTCEDQANARAGQLMWRETPSAWAPYDKETKCYELIQGDIDWARNRVANGDYSSIPNSCILSSSISPVIPAGADLSENLSELRAKVDSLGEPSGWKDADGAFNWLRLGLDALGGAVVGTTAGILTNSLIKKSQLESGYENIMCSFGAGGASNAAYGEVFIVR
jgi:hypothetical protein